MNTTITANTAASYRELEILTGGGINSIFVENSLTGQEVYHTEGLKYDEGLRAELESAIDRVFELAGRINETVEN